MPQSNWTTTCFGKIGSFIVLNKDGWIATCQHIATEIGNAIQSEARAKAIEAQKAAINADGALSNKEKQKQINAIGNLRNNEIDRVAVTWGVNLTTRLQVPQYHGVPVVDLAIGKLDKFDPTWVAEYPVLKDPAKDFEPGVNLCKLGYPFHDIAPAWDAAKDVFELPKEAFPIPQFIIDGILTRLINVVAPNMAAPPPFPMQLFETSPERRPSIRQKRHCVGHSKPHGALSAWVQPACSEEQQGRKRIPIFKCRTLRSYKFHHWPAKAGGRPA